MYGYILRSLPLIDSGHKAVGVAITNPFQYLITLCCKYNGLTQIILSQAHGNQSWGPWPHYT